MTMSNSPLVDYTLISPNRNSPRRHKIDTITIHCVVGQCTVESLGAVFAPAARQGSSNYGVDKDGRIGMYVEEKDRSWCSSNPANDHRAITIEVASDTFHPYAITDAAYKSLIRLCTDICKRNGIKELKWKADPSLIGQVDKQNITAHRWFAATSCPGDYIYERLGDIAAAVNKNLSEQEDEDMTVEKFTELWLEMRKDLQDNDAGKYSAEARDWAVQNGLILGNGNTINGEPNYMWDDLLTRQQAACLFYRLYKLIKNET